MQGDERASFRTALRQARLRAGLTQEALAERSGLGVRSIQHLEGGAHLPHRETISRLTRALGLVGPQASAFERAAASGSWRRSPLSSLEPSSLGAGPTSGAPQRRPGPTPVPGSGERRHVALLNCGLTASSATGTELDPEELAEVLPIGHEAIARIVARHEGSVARIVGGDLVAFFGYPLAREDDPQRAVRAGLEIVETIAQLAPTLARERGVELIARVGIHTGPVVVGQRRVVGPAGTGLELDGSTVGDTASLGAYLAQAAAPNTVSLSDRAFRVVQDFFLCRSVGNVALPWRSEPVAVYQAGREKAVRSRLEAAAARGLTPFVGRTGELQVLRDAFEQARAGRGQVVLLSGEAGAGKSRLLLELHQAIAGSEAIWLEGHCTPSGQNSAYLPFVALLKQAFGVEEADSSRRIVERIDAATAVWREAARPSVPYLKYLLSVDPGDPTLGTMDALRRRMGILDGLRALLLEMSRDRSLVLVVEDLHWIDAASETAHAALADVVATAPVLLLLTYRLGYLPKLPERTYVTRLTLRDLLPVESAALAEAALQVSALPAPLQALIVRKAEGNPLYLEEAVRSLLEAGVIQKVDGTCTITRPIETIQVPDTLQGVILGRIDRLAPSARQALQLASVIGREFTLRLLERISDLPAGLEPAVAELKALELIYEKGYFRELAYLFKHARTHEVAYGTLLLKRRRALHRLVGAAIEELYADRLPEHYETLAHHFQAGMVWEKALEFLVKAAQKASAAYANQDALAYYDQALRVAERVGSVPADTLRTIYQGKGQVCYAIDNWAEMIASYRELRALARSAGNRHVEGLALGGSAHGHLWAHDFDLALADVQAALAVADELEDKAIRIGALSTLGFVEALQGKLDPAREHLHDVIRLSQEMSQPAHKARGRVTLSAVYGWQGEYERAQQIGAEAVALGTHHQMTVLLIQASWTRARALAGQGRYADAIAALRATIALCERTGGKIYQARAWNTLGWIYGELGYWERAIDYNQNGINLVRGEPETIMNARINLADCAFATGHVDQAKRELEELYLLLPGLHEWMKWRYAQHLLHSLGEVLLAAGEAERALRMADECLDLAEPTASRKNIVKARRLRGEVFLAQGKPADAEPELQVAREVAEEIGNPPQLWKTLVALGALRQAQGRADEAHQAYRAALVVIDGVTAGLTDEELRRSFLESAAVQNVRRLADVPAPHRQPVSRS